ncbi:hypothetical protein NMK71_07455 [Weeksellaceae bacterium KMM 9713]|uniref:Uncharacterized protein n=1 Tax=Profundicola chukchiensis TaxID=2961959 RepID=A0A9X4RVW2_9FLAO|nr:hypothetical protein [Profundicola chukchiensis]MDG4946245.1 hypothetical protein [Profundicola chukchiensis]MDG4949645.1 hypothetical protein [Profundicola chukchiensis]
MTSTNISEAYKDSEIIQLASKTGGSLTIELMNYLTDTKNPIEMKIALINALGWDIDGKNNSTQFYEYLKVKNNLKDINEASAEILICYAYLKAMDNYFDVDDAIKYAQKAKSKNYKNSYTINIICVLIEDQKAMDSDWCEVYKLTNNVRVNNLLNKDMKEDAINIIFGYMDLYKDNCK